MNTDIANHTISLSKSQADGALWNVERVVLDTLDFKEVTQQTCNALLTELNYLQLGYRIIVLALADNEKQILHRVSISRTVEAQKALEATPIPFTDLDIPYSAVNNISIQAFINKKPYSTNYWPDILTPPMTAEQAVQVQNVIGIKSSMVYPVAVEGKSVGIIIFSLIKDLSEVNDQEKELLSHFTDVVGIAVQNARLYSSLEAANEQIKQLDKLKDEFVSLASHELRTPMTAIKSYIWMVLDGRGGELNDKLKYYLTRAYMSTDRLINLVNDMLNISRIESGRLTVSMEAVDLYKLAQEIIEEVEPRATEVGVSIMLDPIEQPIPPVLADADKIKEVFINLIGNSLKFTPSGGNVHIHVSQRADMVETKIIDTGNGIEPADLPKLFQKFAMIEGSYTANQPVQGTGLGLYICKALITLHHGTISAASAGRGKGATFTFALHIFTEEDKQKYAVAGNGAKVDLVHSQL